MMVDGRLDLRAAHQGGIRRSGRDGLFSRAPGEHEGKELRGLDDDVTAVADT